MHSGITKRRGRSKEISPQTRIREGRCRGGAGGGGGRKGGGGGAGAGGSWRGGVGGGGGRTHNTRTKGPKEGKGDAREPALEEADEKRAALCR